jgi:hypothetical protein
VILFRITAAIDGYFILGSVKQDSGFPIITLDVRFSLLRLPLVRMAGLRQDITVQQ